MSRFTAEDYAAASRAANVAVDALLYVAQQEGVNNGLAVSEAIAKLAGVAIANGMPLEWVEHAVAEGVKIGKLAASKPS